jgi:hypothetical protein
MPAATEDRFRPVAKWLLLIAALRVNAALFMPALREKQLDGEMLFASTFLLVVHAAFYRFGERFRASKKGSAIGYLGIQGTLAAAIGLYSMSLWLTVLLFGVLGVQAYTLIRHALNRTRAP